MADPGGQAGDQSSPSCFPSHTQRAFDAAATQSRLKTSATPRRAVGREPVIRVQTSRDAVRGMWLIGACWVSGALRPGPASGLSDSSVVSVSDSHRSSKSIEIFECAFMHYHFRATDQVLTHSTIRGRGTRCTVTESAHGRRHAPDASQRIRALPDPACLDGGVKFDEGTLPSGLSPSFSGVHWTQLWLLHTPWGARRARTPATYRETRRVSLSEQAGNLKSAIFFLKL